MPIEFRCTHCQKLLRTPDGTSGKEARCPQCAAIVKIPQMAAAVGSSSAEPRESVTPPAPNPYLSPARPETAFDRETVDHEFRPTRIEIGDVLRRTWQIFQRQWPACFAATFGMPVVLALVLAPFIVMVVFAALAADDEPIYVIAASLVLALVALASSVWLTLGLHGYLLRIARGERATAGDFFGAGPQIIPGVLATLCVSAAVTIGMCMLIVPGVIIALMLSQFINAMVDRRVGVVDSLRLSMQATEGNKVTLFLLGLLMAGINSIAATLTCGLSALVIAPFAALLGCVTYLAMTGQPMAGEEPIERERQLGAGAEQRPVGGKSA